MTASKNPSYPTSDYSGSAGGAASETMERATQTAQQASERLAEKAAYAKEQIKSGYEQASAALHAGVEDLSELQEEWLASARGYVQQHPLVSVAAALAIGMLLARLMPPSQQHPSQHR